MKVILFISSFCLLCLNLSIGQTCDPADPPMSQDYFSIEFKGPQDNIVATAKAKYNFTASLARFSSFWIKTDKNSSVSIISSNPAFPLSKVQEIDSDNSYFNEPPGHTYTFFASAPPFDPSVVFPINQEVFIGNFVVDPPSVTVETVMTDIIPPIFLGTWLYYRNSITFCLPNYKDNLISPGANLPLPIILRTFTAKKENERNVQLTWSTSSEINSSHFIIERSQDGLDWTDIGAVSAAGNSSSTEAYNYLDDDLPLNNRTFNNVLYYKLRLVDLDGKYIHSDIRVVHMNVFDTDHSFAIYPNPSMQYFNIDMTNIDTQFGDLKMCVYDMMGKLIIEKKILGGGIELLDMNNYPTGLYQVKITQGTKQYQSRISKI